MRAAEAMRHRARVITPEVPGYDAAAAWPAPANSAHRHGFRGLRLAYDMSWAPDPGLDRDRLRGHETAVAPILAGLGLTTIREYDQRRFTASLLAGSRPPTRPACVRGTARHVPSGPARPSPSAATRTWRPATMEYAERFDALHDALYRWDVRAAAYLIGGG